MALRRWIGVGLLLLSTQLAACDGFKESLEDSAGATRALKAELGLDAQVSFRTMNGHTSVAVHLVTPFTGDAATVKGQITDVLNRSFRAKVEHVDVSF
jgi:hypothetical protein